MCTAFSFCSVACVCAFLYHPTCLVLWWQLLAWRPILPEFPAGPARGKPSTGQPGWDHHSAGCWPELPWSPLSGHRLPAVAQMTCLRAHEEKKKVPINKQKFTARCLQMCVDSHICKWTQRGKCSFHKISAAVGFLVAKSGFYSRIKIGF